MFIHTAVKNTQTQYSQHNYTPNCSFTQLLNAHKHKYRHHNYTLNCSSTQL